MTFAQTLEPSHSPTTVKPATQPAAQPAGRPSGRPTTAPTLYNTEQSCGGVYGNVKTVVVEFNYTVETDVISTPSTVESKLSRVLQGAFVNSLANAHCAAARRRLRRLEVAAISATTSPQHLGSCKGTVAASKSCSVYEGVVSVQYTGDGGNSNAADVVKNMRETLKSNFESDVYLGIANEAIVGTGVTVTKLAYRESEAINPASPAVAGAQSSATSSPQQGGLTPVEKGLIALGVLLLILLLLIICVCCRLRRRRRSRTGHESGKSDLPGDGRPRFSRAVTKEQSDDDEQPLILADFGNLGLQHSILDVHKCKSASCPECVPKESKQVRFAVLPPRSASPKFRNFDDMEEEKTAESDMALSDTHGSLTEESVEYFEDSTIGERTVDSGDFTEDDEETTSHRRGEI